MRSPSVGLLKLQGWVWPGTSMSPILCKGLNIRIPMITPIKGRRAVYS